MRNSTPIAIGLATALALNAGTAGALDLPTALREVAVNNADLGARAAMVEAARWRAQRSGTWNAPMLELGLVNVPTSGRLDEDPMTMRMVGLSQRVPLFGAQGLARRAARSNLAAETAAGRMARATIMAMALESYAGARYAQERLVLAEAHVSAIQRLVESARARYQSGRGRLDDVLGSEAERARLTADIVMFRAQLGAARLRLDALRGVETDSGDTLAPLMLPAVETTPERSLASLGSEHPRLKELDARVQGYRLSARSARRMAWPDLELRGSYGFRSAIVGPHSTEPQDNMFSIGVGFMLPVFAGGREWAEGREMDAMGRAAAADLRGAELELRRDVLTAWQEASAGERIVGLLADTVLVSRQQTVEAAWAAYGTASIDLWRAMESTHAMYREAVELSRAREDLARAQARLLAATGRPDLLGLEWPTEGAPR